MSTRAFRAVSLATPLRILGWLAICAPPCIYLLFIDVFAVNVPRLDEWNIFIFVQAFLTGHGSFSLLWTQYIENRMVLSRLLMVILARFFLLNMKVEMYWTFGIIVLNVLLIWRLVRSSGHRLSPWFYVPVVLLSFSLCQYESIVWGLEIFFFIVITCCLLVAIALQKTKGHPWYWFAAAVFFGLIASLTAVQGLLIWPIGLVVNAVNRHSPKARVAIWTITGMGVIAYYMVGYRFPRNPRTGVSLAGVAGSYFHFALAVGGAPFSLLQLTPGNYFLTSLGGAAVILLCLFVIGYWIFSDRHDSLMTTAGVLCLLCLGFVAMVTFGRDSAGIGMAFSSRYTTYVLLGLIGPYCAGFRMIRARKRLARTLGRGLWIVTLVLIGGQAALSYRIGWPEGRVQLRTAIRSQCLMAQYRTEPLAILHHNLFDRVGDYRGEIAYIEAHHLSIWATAVPTFTRAECAAPPVPK